MTRFELGIHAAQQRNIPGHPGMVGGGVVGSLR